jgi:hypothetical protein
MGDLKLVSASYILLAPQLEGWGVEKMVIRKVIKIRRGEFFLPE